MLKPEIRKLFMLAALVVAALSSGCATGGDHRVDLFYQRTASGSGGSGDLYILEETPPPTGGATTIQWIIGEIRKGGDKVGNTITDTAPADTVTAAYIQELKAAGYNTVQVHAMPVGVAKGMILKSATIKVDEVKSVTNLEVKCKVTAGVEPWRDGKALDRVEYEADYAESTLTGRDQLASKTLLHAIQTLMRRSVPEIVKMIEQR